MNLAEARTFTKKKPIKGNPHKPKPHKMPATNNNNTTTTTTNNNNNSIKTIDHLSSIPTPNSNPNGNANFILEPHSEPKFPVAKFSDPKIIANTPNPLSESFIIQTNPLQFVLSLLLGSPVKVFLSTGECYKGILHLTSDSSALDILLKYASPMGPSSLLHDSKTLPRRPYESLFIPSSYILDIEALVDFEICSKVKTKPTKFKTDSDITGIADIKARELHKWNPDDFVELTSSSSYSLYQDFSQTNSFDLNSENAAKDWDQFAANEKLFGLTTSFDEEIYTTKIDRNRSDYKQREQEAIRIANQILNAPSSSLHILEERNQVINTHEIDEEDKYGAVIRDYDKADKYIPPYLRAKALKNTFDSPKPLINNKKPDTPRTYTQLPKNAKLDDPSIANSSFKLIAGDDPAFNPNIDDPNSMLVNAASRVDFENSNNSIQTNKAVEALAKLNIRTIQTTKLTENMLETYKNDSTNFSSRNTLHRDFPENSTVKPLPRLNKSKIGVSESAKIDAAKGLSKNIEAMREKIKQHRKNSYKGKVAELVSFSNTFKLNTPIPSDLKEIIQDTKSDKTKSDIKQGTSDQGSSDPVAATPTTTSTRILDVAQSKPTSAKLSAKAPLFVPNVKAAVFVPLSKRQVTVPKAAAIIATPKKSTFFGSRILDKDPVKLWGHFYTFSIGEKTSLASSTAPIWPSETSTPYLRVFTSLKNNKYNNNKLESMNPVLPTGYNPGNMHVPQIPALDYQFMGYPYPANQPHVVHYMHTDPNGVMFEPQYQQGYIQPQHQHQHQHHHIQSYNGFNNQGRLPPTVVMGIDSPSPMVGIQHQQGQYPPVYPTHQYPIQHPILPQQNLLNQPDSSQHHASFIPDTPQSISGQMHPFMPLDRPDPGAPISSVGPYIGSASNMDYGQATEYQQHPGYAQGVNFYNQQPPNYPYPPPTSNHDASLTVSPTSSINLTVNPDMAYMAPYPKVQHQPEPVEFGQQYYPTTSFTEYHQQSESRLEINSHSQAANDKPNSIPLDHSAVVSNSVVNNETPTPHCEYTHPLPQPSNHDAKTAKANTNANQAQSEPKKKGPTVSKMPPPANNTGESAKLPNTSASKTNIKAKANGTANQASKSDKAPKKHAIKNKKSSAKK